VEDLSDNEREEQLRRWWAENWLWIAGGIALGLAALAGFQYWQKTRLAASESDEKSYLAVLDSLSHNDASAASKKADDLRATHPRSPYTDQSDLALARAYIGAGKLDDAAKRLRVVYESSRDPQLRLVAQTRLARVLSEQGKHDDAIKLLDLEQAGSFRPVFHEIRGDVLLAKGDAAGARREYEAALASAGKPEDALVDSQYVQLKLDALPATATAAVASDVKPKPAAAGTQP
jgi:predicted negative regulator of RcsB-dependent stress response